MKRKAWTNHSQRGSFKKPKRSRNFWKSRKTAEIAAVPQSDSSSSDEGEEEPRTETNYDQLLTAFSTTNKVSAIDSDSEGDSEEDEDEGLSETEEALEEEEDENSDEDIEEEQDVEDEEGVEEIGEEEEEGDANESAEEEEEEAVESAEEEESQDEENESETPAGENDPFTIRFESTIPAELATACEGKSKEEDLRWSNLGSMKISYPDFVWQKQSKAGKKKLLDGDGPEMSDNLMNMLGKNFVSKSLDGSTMKPDLMENIASANIPNLPDGALSNGVAMTTFQSELMAIFNSYKDFCFNERTHQNGEEIRFVYALHALNHVMKTRTRILKNTKMLTKHRSKGGAMLNVRDQGLCRPKVLIVVPFRDSCKRIVEYIIKLLYPEEKGQVQNKTRFLDDFDSEEMERRNKPDDFYSTFSGNIDDSFKIGLTVTKKSLKLFSDFYSSDIIIASPLGLRMVIGVEGEKDRDYDFLNSIELLVLDQMDIFTMQNWDHVTHLFDHLHLQPARSHNVDFTRVRSWCLENLGKFYRQTLMFSSVSFPEMNAIFRRSCVNFMGKVRLDNTAISGSACQVVSPVPMDFYRFEASSSKDAVDKRLQYFVNKVIPDFKKDTMFHTMVVVPSYFDFVKVRNWFRQSDLDFMDVCEYTKDKKVAEARDKFFHKDTHFLLYTERVHFYRRFAIKGIRHLIFYQLPFYPHLFAELCNLTQGVYQNKKSGSDGNMSITVMYNRYDVHRLAAVLGTEKAKEMTKIEPEKRFHRFLMEK